MSNVGTISNLGIGSGLDTASLLDQLTRAEQAPLTALKTREQSYNTKLSAYGSLQGLLSQLESAAKQASDPTVLGGYTASSSATSVLGATAAAGASAGTYNVNVSALAQAQTLVTGDVASTSSQIGSTGATVTIAFGAITGGTLANGTYSGATFTPDATKSQITVNLAAGQTSLSQVRDAINAAAAGKVSASIVNDGTGNRLVLSSSATGASSSMQVAVTDGSGNPSTNTALNALLDDDPAGAQNMTQTVAAQNAALTVNGIAVTSATNTVTNAVQGVTMTLAGNGAGTLDVQRNTAGVQSAINNVVSAYNTLNTGIQSLTAYDPGSKNGGPLIGDATVRMIQSRLQSLITAVHAGQAGDPATLNAIGVTFQKDGSLAVDSAKLSAALSANPDGVQRLLMGTTSAPGVMAAVSSGIDGFNDPVQGVLAMAQSGTSRTIADLQKNEAAMQDQIDATIANYRQQFVALDKIMSSLTATGNYLTQQFNAMSASSSSSSKG